MQVQSHVIALQQREVVPPEMHQPSYMGPLYRPLHGVPQIQLQVNPIAIQPRLQEVIGGEYMTPQQYPHPQLLTIQGDPEDLPSRLGRIFLVAVMKNNGLPAYPNVCSSFSTIPGFLTLLKTYNTALLNATSFPELTAIRVVTLYYTGKYMTLRILTAI